MDIFNEKTILSVSRLTALLRGILEENFEQVWVEGEVSNLSTPSSGHLYFSIKDSGAQLRCIMFKSSAKNLKFRPTDGMGLIVRGRISVYDQRGEYQLICEYLEPAGIGALQQAFIQLKERLAREGLFAEEHKRELPPFPHRIGVVTSPTGAAIHDILNVLKRRFASLEILLYPVRVQGEGAAAEIARAIDDMNRLGLVDVLIVGRGGGSLEDLWAFNEEVVARAVHRSRLPVISAVGHETDWTICDFTADLRAPTPSAAAELVVASSVELHSRLESLQHRLHLAIESRLAALGSQVDALRRSLHDPSTMLGHLSQRIDDLTIRMERGVEGRLAALESRVEVLRRSLHDPSTMLGHLSQRIGDLTIRMERALENGMVRGKARIDSLHSGLLHASPRQAVEKQRQVVDLLRIRSEQFITVLLDRSRREFGTTAVRLDVLSPLQTLSRGYAIATSADGKVLTSSGQLQPGERLKLSLHHGRATCLVEDLEGP